MTLNRNYLKGEEIAVIITEMVKHESSIEREMLKIGLVAQILIDNLGEFEDNTDIYDIYMSQDEIDFSRDIKNYNDIDVLVSQELSVEKAIRDFLVDINKKLDKSFKKLPKDLKDFKLEDLVNQFKEVVDNGKEL